jgi:macrolide transport system ATP-binding/permease protein
LPQVISSLSAKTIDDLIFESQGDLRELEEHLRHLENSMGKVTGDELTFVMAEYTEAVERYERRGGYEIGYRLDSVLTGLSVNHIPRNRAINTLSGGEKARVGIAALLLKSPDLLILDEPTNHLDFRSMEWLEYYLKEHRGAFLVVSHDREFLNRTVSLIIEIVEHKRESRVYHGDYDAFLESKRSERKKREADFERQQEEIKELKQTIRTRARQVGHNRPAPDRDKITHKFFGERVQKTVSRNVNAAEERLRQIYAALIPKPPEELRINPDFNPQDLKGRVPLTASHINKMFGHQNVLNDISFMLSADSRIVIMGPNGSGKSTLLKILAGLVRPDSGDVLTAPSVRIGYLDQEQETLNLNKSVYETYAEGMSGDREEIKASLLRFGFFTYEEFSRPVEALSTGQKRKLQIAILIAERGNLLLLDEPTNHISFEVIEEFENALMTFAGPVLAASHDRRFIKRFAGEIWALRDGRLTRHLDAASI